MKHSCVWPQLQLARLGQNVWHKANSQSGDQAQSVREPRTYVQHPDSDRNGRKSDNTISLATFNMASTRKRIEEVVKSISKNRSLSMSSTSLGKENLRELDELKLFGAPRTYDYEQKRSTIDL